MRKSVTVNEAISRGQKTVNYPVFGIMILCLIFSVYLFSTSIPIIISILFLICSITVFPWIYWSFAIVYWRIWAFSNVRNVHKLKRKAIEGKLIWPDDSYFNKTEIRSEKQQRILERLKLKFNLPDIHETIHDDKTLPRELIIYNSRTLKYLQIIGSSLVILFGLYLILTDEFGSGILIFGGGVYFFNDTNKISLVEPQIIFSDKGFKVGNYKFTSWSKISYIRLELRGSGKHAKWHLVYKKKRGMEYSNKSILQNLDFSNKELEDFIKIYQQRNRQKNRRN